MIIKYFEVMKKTTGYRFMDKGKRGPYYVYVGSIDNQGREKTTHNSLVADEVHEYNFEMFQKYFPEMCSWTTDNIKGNPTLQYTPGHRYCEVNSTLLYFKFETSQRAKKFIAEWQHLKEFTALINFSHIASRLNPLTVWRDPNGYTGRHVDLIQKYFPVEWNELAGRAMNDAQRSAMRQLNDSRVLDALSNLTFPHWYGEIYHPDEGRWKSLRFRTEKEKLIFKMGYITK